LAGGWDGDLDGAWDWDWDGVEMANWQSKRRSWNWGHRRKKSIEEEVLLFLWLLLHVISDSMSKGEANSTFLANWATKSRPAQLQE